MDIIKAYAVHNLCYKKAQPMTPKGIVVHSTYANNPYLKRYVDAPDAVGKNQYGNHWNVEKPGGNKVCVHAFIGYDKDKRIRVAEILPLNICCWGVGSGSKGSYNYNPPHIQFEICEDSLENEAYYREAFGIAAEYCVYLCKNFHLPVSSIVGHAEAHRMGYGSNHRDPEHWMKKFGETMDDFRRLVASKMTSAEDHSDANKKVTTTESEDKPSSIRNGDLVAVAREATYYDGTKMPDWVKNSKWYVLGNPKGDRAVLDQNEARTNSICSAVSTKFLTIVKQSGKNCPYLVRVTQVPMTIRKESSNSSGKTGSINKPGVFTIVEEKSGWGKLKSGLGWIPLNRVNKM